MPEVSIIVPIYNVESYLSRCIDSILNQSYTNFELILVNDGSPDNCGTICDQYAATDHRIIVIHKENGGVSSARNSALNIAQGDFITFCDSDDYWDPNLLEIAMRSLSNSNADCLVFGFFTHTLDGLVTPRKLDAETLTFSEQTDNVSYLIDSLLSGRHGWEVCNHIFSRDIIRKHGIRFSTTCENYAEDLCFVCQYMLHSHRLICIPDNLYHYIHRKDSMMRTSEGVFKLNALNEVSFSVGQEYYKTIHSHVLQRQFPILHFMIVNTELRKMHCYNKHTLIPSEIKKIHRKKWWMHNMLQLYFCYNTLKKHFGSHLAQRTLLFNTYLHHGNWTLYSYESGLYYKWYNRKRSG